MEQGTNPFLSTLERQSQKSSYNPFLNPSPSEINPFVDQAKPTNPFDGLGLNPFAVNEPFVEQTADYQCSGDKVSHRLAQQDLDKDDRSTGPPTVSSLESPLKSSLQNTPSSFDYINRQKTIHQDLFNNPHQRSKKERIHVPDTTYSNRRPPVCTKLHYNLPRTSPKLKGSSAIQDINQASSQLKTTVRHVCVSGCYMVTCNNHLKFWYIPTGENYKTIDLKESKVTAMVMLPTLYPDNDTLKKTSNAHHLRVWVALDKGEIVEISVVTGQILARQVVHYSAVVTFVHNGASLWSIDESGCAKLWTDIDNTSAIMRPPLYILNEMSSKSGPGLVCHGTKLWVSHGKFIEVFNIRLKELPGSEVLGDSWYKKRLDPNCTIGNISCLIKSKNQVLSGHDDGKIVVWGMDSYAKIKVIHASMYKITNLLLFDSRYLWTSFNTGKICVYDTLHDFQLKKDFIAYYNSAVVLMKLDMGCFLISQDTQMNDLELPIVSVSDNGQVRYWDACLSDDYMIEQIEERENEYSKFNNLKVFIGTWNLDSLKPSIMENVIKENNVFLTWIRSFMSIHMQKKLDLTLNNDDLWPDLLVINFQELVDLESTKSNAKLFLKKKSKKEASKISNKVKQWEDLWRKLLKEHIPEFPFRLIESAEMVGLCTMIFVKDSLCHRVTNLAVDKVKTGLGGLHGNKGAIAIRMLIDDSSFCFVNAHLAAHQKEISARNNDASTIVHDIKFKQQIPSFQYTCCSGGDGTLILDHESVFWCGDLNYRIDLDREYILNAIEEGDWTYLMAHDQLIHQQRNNPNFVLKDFKEGPLLFAPTFKYDLNSNEYDTSDKKRAPAWCDRILYRGRFISLSSYRRQECKLSDHRPVSATFDVQTKTVDNVAYKTIQQTIESIVVPQRSKTIIYEAFQEWLKEYVCFPEHDIPEIHLDGNYLEIRSRIYQNLVSFADQVI